MFCCGKMFNKKVKIMKLPAVVPNDNEGVELAEDSDIEPHYDFVPGVLYESVATRDARLEAEKNGQPIVKDVKYALHPKMSRSRRETLTDILTADKAKADKSVNVDMADTATIDMADVETLSEAVTKAADETKIEV